MSLLFNGFFFGGKFCHLGDKKKTNGSIFLHFLHSFGKKLSKFLDFLGHILIKFLVWGQFFFGKFLLFGQFSKNLSPFNAKFFLGCSLMMVHQKIDEVKCFDALQFF
jgi:hypothetical protein